LCCSRVLVSDDDERETAEQEIARRPARAAEHARDLVADIERLSAPDAEYTDALTAIVERALVRHADHVTVILQAAHVERVRELLARCAELEATHRPIKYVGSRSAREVEVERLLARALSALESAEQVNRLMKRKTP
jgi:hypothetical protein